jgi:hypothetical protein
MLVNILILSGPRGRGSYPTVEGQSDDSRQENNWTECHAPWTKQVGQSAKYLSKAGQPEGHAPLLEQINQRVLLLY